MKNYKPHQETRIAANGASVSENFAKWFGASQTTNSDGSPMVLFHGTHSDFSRFEKAKVGANYAADEKGFFFVNDPGMASQYATSTSYGTELTEGSCVLAAYVALKRPLIINDEFLKAEMMQKIGIDEDVVSFWDNYQSLILDWAEMYGSDGVILVDKTHHIGKEPMTMVVAFEPHQIKSAHNCGLFVKNSADLNDVMAQKRILRANKAKDALESFKKLSAAPV